MSLRLVFFLINFSNGKRNYLGYFKIYTNENSTIRLGFIWDTKTLKVYVDGFLYQTITEPVVRPYWGLNYNPIKYVKSFLPENQQGVTVINDLLFNDTTSELLEPTVKGE